ncbi:Uncharacterised protein [Morganella morganii]|nr:Uncharacterised protein [Morganella morganii]
MVIIQFPVFRKKFRHLPRKISIPTCWGRALAITLLLQGHGGSVADFNRGMESILPLALAQLDAQPAAVTRQMFDSIDGRWWDKRQRVPEKFLVLRRDYSVSDDRLPSQPARENRRRIETGITSALPGLAAGGFGVL